MAEFIVWCPDYSHDGPEDGKTITANRPEAAAEEWAQRDDCESADYHIIGGQDVDVMVTSPDGSTKRFNVRGVVNYDYYAKEITPEAAANHGRAMCITGEG